MTPSEPRLIATNRVNCQTAKRHSQFVARMKRSEMRGQVRDKNPGFASGLHPASPYGLCRAHARHRPSSSPARGGRSLLSLFPFLVPRRGVRNDRAKPAPAAPALDAGSPHAVGHGTQAVVQPQRSKPVELNRALEAGFACVPHATVLSACNSQRPHVLGALTECLVPPHCWVLGPPTTPTGRLLSLLCRQHASRHATRTKGP